MKTQDIIVHPANEREMNVIKAFFNSLNIKFEVAEESSYHPEFVAKVQEGRQHVKDGKVTRVEQEDLSQFLGLR